MTRGYSWSVENPVSDRLTGIVLFFDQSSNEMNRRDVCLGLLGRVDEARGGPASS